MPEIARSSDGLRLKLDQQEADILRELLKEMRLLLEADVPTQDDVISRLFPRAHEDDQEEATYQALVRDELWEVKREALRTVADALGSQGAAIVSLSDEQVDTWLRFLNDVRLAIGTRLQVDEGKMSKVYDAEDPEGPALAVLHWLGWLQGSLLEEMARADD